MPQMSPIPCFLMEVLIFSLILILSNLLYFLYKPTSMMNTLLVKAEKKKWSY